eukprot:TRINITY_DN17201_c0_g2_i1.p1 TRINITY_DN17201_c0_g2~~TRINITY_DN17201_c0_g2_i1.p1  ORF type:complete len:115 (+),score=10.54 TRINITY_DN17201_c0_g2_i1:149-493(+)
MWQLKLGKHTGMRRLQRLTPNGVVDSYVTFPHKGPLCLWGLKVSRHRPPLLALSLLLHLSRLQQQLRRHDDMEFRRNSSFEVAKGEPDVGRKPSPLWAYRSFSWNAWTENGEFW